jgi:cyclophilin family peptidyl-prolyl cis-trans isomerase
LLAACLAAVGSLALAAEAPKPKPKARAKAAAAKAPKKAETKTAPDPETLGPGTYALLETEKGNILLRFFPEESPNTVANFVELARGERPWKTQKGVWVARRFYDGLTFHRIERDELIQGGDPKGDGTGGPGYKFDNEQSEKLDFSEAGRVAMANSGRDTNGSQFFITLKPTPQYDGKHTIFGEVVHGLDVVRTISRMPATGRRIHKARKPVAMKKVVITVVEPKTEEGPSAGKAKAKN